MAHTIPSSIFSPSTGDEGCQLVRTTAVATGGNPMYTSTPAHADMSTEHRRKFPDTLSEILNVVIHTKASLKTGGLDAALATMQEKLGSAEISAQVEKLTSSESDGDRNEIASKLAAMLMEGDANLTEERKGDGMGGEEGGVRGEKGGVGGEKGGMGRGEGDEEHKEDKDKLESRYYEAQTEWQERHAADKAEREKQERHHQTEVRKWENLYDGEVRRRETLEEELKTLKERLRPR
ncbi:hypothetical protein BDN71DRAFT_1428865 [Pleurotus eryngii]|uniref:Uncharacterized protein n=1 Tax=Pleurotus eryngii TaxID=5323 RepID=A0A9P6A1L0_PLEER|nr:hypothetical protein BDN71DRAFT_1428865 [Pleurotus eryngii]